MSRYEGPWVVAEVDGRKAMQPVEHVSVERAVTMLAAGFTPERLAVAEWSYDLGAGQ